MFPFLAPLRQPNSRLQVNTQDGHHPKVFFEFLLVNPHKTTALLEKAKASPRHERKLSPRPTSRPSSSQDRVSPVPHKTPTPAEKNVSRQRNKGLETSSAMRDLFGGAGTSFGAGACFEKIPSPKSSPQKFGRKTVLEREPERGGEWQIIRHPPRDGVCFNVIEDHELQYQKTTKRGNWKSSESAFEKALPGPEFERVEDQEEVPASECPAVAVLEKMKKEGALPDDWVDTVEEEAAEKTEKEKVAVGVPGPDLGDDEELTEVLGEEEKSTEKCPGVPRKGEGEREEGVSTGAGPESEGEAGDEDEAAAIPPQEDAAIMAAKATAAGAGGADALLIRGAQIVNDDSVFTADVFIEEGLIKQVSPCVQVDKDVPVLDATGKMLLPAGIDVHTFLSQPSSVDDFPAGTKAAVAGGTATIVDVVGVRESESLLSAFQRVRAAAEGKSLCNVAFSVLIQRWDAATQKDLEKLVLEHGVNSVIVDVAQDDQFLQALELCKSLGVLVRFLPENKSIVGHLEKKLLELGITGPEGFLQSRPEELEGERVASVCVLSRLANCPVSVLSVSSPAVVERLSSGRQSGCLVHAEVPVSAVATDGTHYFNTCLKHAASHLTATPLRPDPKVGKQLVQLLASFPLAVCVSDHSAHSSASRTSAGDFTRMPRGVAAVEERLAVVWEKAVREGSLDPMRFVAVTSSNAAKLLNLYPRKGRIAVGADADIVVWDASQKRKLGAATSSSGADVSVFEGLSVHANAVATIVGGKVVWRDGAVKEKTAGKVLQLSPNSPYLFSVVQQREKTTSVEKVEREGAAPAARNGAAEKERPLPTHRKHLESSIGQQGEDSGVSSMEQIRRLVPPSESSTSRVPLVSGEQEYRRRRRRSFPPVRFSSRFRINGSSRLILLLSQRHLERSFSLELSK